MAYNQTPPLSPNAPWGRRAIDTISAALRGKTNNRGEITLTAGAATTTLTDEKIGADSVIALQAMTANAAAEIGAGTLYFSAMTGGAATITHANNAQTDRTFRYTVTG